MTKVSYRLRLFGFVAVAGLLWCETAVSQTQSKDQQKCLTTLSKDGAKVAATQGKENTACVKNATKGKEGDLAACLTRDSKGKVAKAAAKTNADFDKKCSGETPDFGLPSGETGAADAVNAGALAPRVAFVNDIFGDNLTAVISTNKTAGGCQSTVVKDAEKHIDTVIKNYLGCEKSALKAGGDQIELEACVGDDPGGKAGKTAAKLAADIGKKCSANEFGLGSCGGASLGDLADCVVVSATCRACQAVNGMKGITADCDLVDDGVANNSCAGEGGDDGECCSGELATCTFAPSSELTLQLAILPLTVPLNGSIGVTCGPANESGTVPCTCQVNEIDPISVIGIGVACVEPAAVCDPGEIDCAGGKALGQLVTGDRNIGECSSNADCRSQCEEHCGGEENVLPGAANVGCAGFCTGGSPCLSDVECANLGEGSCNGQDDVLEGNICYCTCLTPLAEPGSVGDMSCQLSMNVNLEVSEPCDGEDIIVTAGGCIALSTQSQTTILENANNFPGTTLERSGEGTPGVCSEIDAGSTTGMTFIGGVPVFGTPFGDAIAFLEIDCQ